MGFYSFKFVTRRLHEQRLSDSKNGCSKLGFSKLEECKNYREQLQIKTNSKLERKICLHPALSAETQKEIQKSKANPDGQALGLVAKFLLFPLSMILHK